MAGRRNIPVINYSLAELPPRVFWKIQFLLARRDAGTFVEHLHSIASERRGASFYYPDLDHDRTLCRYEWHRRLDNDKYGLRLGIVVDVGASDVSELEAYVTRSSVFDDLTRAQEPLAEDIVQAAQAEIFAILDEVQRRRQAHKENDFVIVYHIEVPYQYGFVDRLSTSDGRLHILRTRILKDRNRRVSAVLIKERGTSHEIAKARAFRQITIACALFTLANNQRYETAALSWPRNRPPLQSVASEHNLNEDRLYTTRRVWPPLEETSPEAAIRCEWIWDAFSGLSEPDRKFLLSPLFAYYSSSVRKRDLSTLSVVGFVAALAALAASRRASCEGSLSCSSCGALTMRHDRVSEITAITDLVVETCRIKDPSLVDDLRDMLQRVHRKQRSAFVHGAALRHQEYGTGAGFPPQMPTNDAPVQDLFEYAQDLSSISAITRRTLLEWVAARSGRALDHRLFLINTERVTSKLLHTMHVTAPGPAVIRLSLASRSGVV